MATSSNTTKTKPDNPNLTRSRSLGRKPKPVASSDADGSDRKTVEKPVPNYLKPTISSRPDPVKFLKKNSAADDKLLRRRSFDRPPSSLTSSTSSSHKSLNTSPARPRDRPVVPREKPVTGLRSSSFHGTSRGGLRGGSTVKSGPVGSRGSPGVKKSGLSGGSSSKSKKEGSGNVTKKGKEISSESSSPVAPAQKDEEEIVKVETDVQVSDHIEEDKDHVAQPEESSEEKETGLVDASKEEVVQPDESSEEKEADPVDASKEEEKEELINDDKTEEQTEEQKEQENTEEDNNKDKEEVDDKEESTETVVTPDTKEAENVEESKEDPDTEAKAEEESESSKVEEAPTETKDEVEESPEEGTKKEVVQAKKESPSAYNDVIASKVQESSRKNKVLALAGAFQTVIDYETAASK
ncbi:unnamed protein product [Eruca vesicaria subsp. sativa]|uniref:Calmodulin-binding domain-containing protein n=1 Tax=Eruca vesicaria subsp. sativa TaxID=29727 RepID=A0ABC8KC52_ERUVS|nr:unnamed protein product [Eruca vesicaria subsp. sativa]